MKIRTLKIHPKTAKFLKWKTVVYLLSQDKNFVLTKFFLKRPLKYGFNFFKSVIKKKPYKQVGNFFLYGFDNIEEFEDQLQKKDNLLIFAFGYCHKPFNCPAKRFSEKCSNDPNNDICRQCFIGKCINCLPKGSIALSVTTVHYIGKTIFELIEKNPDRKILFISTACELALKMCSDWGNMVNIKGVGVQLCGRVCHTMEAFKFAERGIKPHLTEVHPDDMDPILSLLKLKR